MKLSHDWLKDFVDIRISPRKLADRLTMSGLEVEELESVGKDVHYELGVTPNRSDCLSVIGVARDVAAVTGRKLKNVAVKPPRGKGRISDRLKVTVKNPARCPRYTARVIEGVRIGPSPAWMVKRLAAAGVRSINNVVDATNYVMLERGQPLHAFDERTVHGGKIVVRVAGDTEEFRTLDGCDRKLDPVDLLICDAEKPVALGGVMGGENSEVSDNTENLILESAYFEPLGIRRTSKRLGLISESSRRFERGVDPNGVLDALHRLTEVIVEVAGGTPTSDWIDVYKQKIKPARIVLRSAEVERVLGVRIPPAKTKKILGSLGFSAAGTSERINVTVPTFRPDISREIDLIEELARIYGYDRVPSTLPYARTERLAVPRVYEEMDWARDVLVDLGFFETLLPAFENEEIASIFADDSDASPAIVTNPLSGEESVMRTQLISGLFRVAQLNVSRQRNDLKLFALQRVYQRPVGNIRASEPLRLAGLMAGKRNPSGWQASEEGVGFYDAKGAVEAVISRLDLADQLLFQRGGQYDFLVPGSYATVLIANKRVGWVGLLHPETVHRWDLDQSIYGFELDFESIAAQARQVKARFQELSRYPYVERDLSILVDSTTPHVEVERTISQSLNTLLTDVRLFDVYRGKGIPQGKKSMAYTIRYASEDRTLTDEEVNEAHGRVIEAVKEHLNAVLR